MIIITTVVCKEFEIAAILTLIVYLVKKFLTFSTYVFSLHKLHPFSNTPVNLKLQRIGLTIVKKSYLLGDCKVQVFYRIRNNANDLPVMPQLHNHKFNQMHNFVENSCSKVFF